MSYTLETNTDSSKIIHLNSKDADKSFSNTTSYCLFTLDTPIEIDDNHAALISLNSAIVPYSIYNIRDNINRKILSIIDYFLYFNFFFLITFLSFLHFFIRRQNFLFFAVFNLCRFDLLNKAKSIIVVESNCFLETALNFLTRLPFLIPIISVIKLPFRFFNFNIWE